MVQITAEDLHVLRDGKKSLAFFRIRRSARPSIRILIFYVKIKRVVVDDRHNFSARLVIEHY